MKKQKDKMKILIVDDNEKDLKLLESMLFQLGFEDTVKSRHGMEALELVKTQHPNLIFLDIIMPGIDGGAVKEALKEKPETKDIPTIFLSSIISKEEEKRIGRLAGGEIILAKPYSSEELQKVRDKALESVNGER